MWACCNRAQAARRTTKWRFGRSKMRHFPPVFRRFSPCFFRELALEGAVGREFDFEVLLEDRLWARRKLADEEFDHVPELILVPIIEHGVFILMPQDAIKTQRIGLDLEYPSEPGMVNSVSGLGVGRQGPVWLHVEQNGRRVVSRDVIER
jgi:hypothetical protein